MDPVHLEYQLTPEDLKEALRWRAPAQRMTFRRGLLGWLVFVAVAALMFLWLRQATPPGRPGSAPPPSTNLMTDILLPIVPWILILGFIWFFVFRGLRAGRKQWENNPAFQQVQIFNMDEEGVRIANPLTDALYRWNAFVGWAETQRLFLLLLPNRARLPVPKRAIGDHVEQERFRAFINPRAHAPTGAFPVMAPKPVLPADIPNSGG